MLELASHYGEGPIELREIAEKEDISLKYLEQVIIPIRTAGYVKSVRGSKGGYILAKPPSQIHLSDLVEILNGPIHLVECIDNPNVCLKTPHCVTRDIWRDVSEAIYHIFRSVTLEDMVRRKREKEKKNSPMYQI